MRVEAAPFARRAALLASILTLAGCAGDHGEKFVHSSHASPEATPTATPAASTPEATATATPAEAKNCRHYSVALEGGFKKVVECCLGDTLTQTTDTRTNTAAGIYFKHGSYTGINDGNCEAGKFMHPEPTPEPSPTAPPVQVPAGPLTNI